MSSTMQPAHPSRDGAPPLSPDVRTAGVTADDFKAIFRGHPGGVSVVTADVGDGPVALTVTSMASVSVDPPLLVFSASALSSATPTLLRADTVVVHLLDADDLDVARLGAASGVDRFADPEVWQRLPTGEPLYRGVRAWVRGAVIGRMEAGGSTVIAVEALETGLARDLEPGEVGTPLVYHNRSWHRLSAASQLA